MKARWVLLALLLPYGWLLAQTFTAVRLAILDKQSADWPTTSATVVESSTADTCSRRGDASHRLVYSYFAAGTPYTGATKSFVPEPCNGPTDTRRAVEQFPIGATIQVHVHPFSPNMSVVLTNQRSALDHFELAALGLSLLAVPSAAWLYARRRLTPRSS